MGQFVNALKEQTLKTVQSAQLVGLWILDDTGMNNEFQMVIQTQKLNSINCAFSDKH